MPTVDEHYRAVLAGIYSWMFGGFDAGLAQNREFFDRHGIVSAGSGRAVDLGCGCGFQTIPLAERGFDVTAIDLDHELLDELEQHRGSLPILTVRDDMRNFESHLDSAVELVVCMTDTLLHLDSLEAVRDLVARVYAALEPGGAFIASFRDLSTPARELDRFIPVRSDANNILLCFLEYEPEHVKVHDLVYRRNDARWHFSKSFYRKLRLSADTFRALLAAEGFNIEGSPAAGASVTAIARK